MSNTIELEEHNDVNRTYDKNFSDISSLSDEEWESKKTKQERKERKEKKAKKEKEERELLEYTRQQKEIFDERLTMIIRAYKDQWIYVVEGNYYWDTNYARQKRLEIASYELVKEEEKIIKKQEVDRMANRWMDMKPCIRCKQHLDFGNRSNYCECCLLDVDADLDEFTEFSIYFKN
jgi:hypothetical protein